MKKRVLKTLCSKALAVTVGATMTMQAYGPTIASAAEDKLYISEVYLSYGKDDASAKRKTTRHSVSASPKNKLKIKKGSLLTAE